MLTCEIIILKNIHFIIVMVTGWLSTRWQMFHLLMRARQTLGAVWKRENARVARLLLVTMTTIGHGVVPELCTWGLPPDYKGLLLFPEEIVSTYNWLNLKSLYNVLIVFTLMVFFGVSTTSGHLARLIVSVMTWWKGFDLFKY